MAKPTITTRAGKGAALTYTELDTNFSNIKDATITITGGSTAVTADLNGNISLVAGSNVTITGNNTAKTITIASTGGTSTWVGTATSDLIIGQYVIRANGTGNINVDDDINFPSGSGPNVPSGGQLLCRGGDITLQVTNNPGLQLSGATTGTPSNTSTPSTYLKINVNGSNYFIPLYS